MVHFLHTRGLGAASVPLDSCAKNYNIYYNAKLSTKGTEMPSTSQRLFCCPVPSSALPSRVFRVFRVSQCVSCVPRLHDVFTYTPPSSRSNVRGLVLKLVRSSNRSGVPHRPPLSPLSPTCSPNTRASNSNITAMKERHNTSLRARGTPWVDVSDGYWSDGLSDSDGSTSSTALEGRGRGRRRVTSDGLSNLLGVDLARRDETDTACDIFLEAVSTESMQDEFLQTLSLEVCLSAGAVSTGTFSSRGR